MERMVDYPDRPYLITRAFNNTELSLGGGREVWKKEKLNKFKV